MVTRLPQVFAWRFKLTKHSYHPGSLGDKLRLFDQASGLMELSTIYDMFDTLLNQERHTSVWTTRSFILPVQP